MFTLAVLFISVAGEAHYEVEERLRRSLFEHYNKNVAPLTDINENITLHIGLSLLSIDELDVTKEVLRAHVWLIMAWHDVRLTWDPSEYNGQKQISVPIGLIWKPDIMLFNNADLFSPAADYAAAVFEGGSILYVPHVFLTTSCSVDLRHFPFDQHTCEIKLGSWTYNADTISLEVGNFELDNFQENNVWELANYSHEIVSTKYPCCPETYHSYVAKIVLRRRIGLLMNMYVAPAVCIGLVLPSIFLLPTGSSQKLIMGSGLLIGQVLLLEMIVEILPINDMTVPRLAVYYLSNIVLISLALVLSAVIACLLHRSRSGSRVPGLVSKIFLDIMGRLLCVGRQDYLISTEDDDAHKVQMNSEWCQLATVLDRLFGIIFLGVAIIAMISLSAYSSHD